MVIEDIVTLLKVIGASSVAATLAYLAVWSIKHPEKVEKWWKLTAGLRCRLIYGLAHQRIESGYRGTLLKPLKSINEEVEGNWPEEIVIEFVSPEEYGEDFVEGKVDNGTIYIKKAWESNIGRCYQRITYAYYRDGTFQRIRNFVDPDYMEALYLALTMAALGSSKKRSPLTSFIKEKLAPLLKRPKADAMRRFFKSFRDLEGGGMLTTILARELNFVERKVIQTTDPIAVDSEAKSVLLFLDRIRHKERREKVELDFEGAFVKFKLIPVGKLLTRILGTKIYVDRIERYLTEGTQRLYVWGVGDENVKMINEIGMRYHFKGTLVTKIEKGYHSTHSLCVLPSIVLRITIR